MRRNVGCYSRKEAEKTKVFNKTTPRRGWDFVCICVRMETRVHECLLRFSMKAGHGTAVSVSM